jgi:hypothetical protein
MSLEEVEERERREKMPFIAATYVYASTQGQHTHSARTNKKLKRNGHPMLSYMGLWDMGSV